MMRHGAADANQIFRFQVLAPRHFVKTAKAEFRVIGWVVYKSKGNSELRLDLMRQLHEHGLV